eukprot:gene34374-41604_t
MATSSTKQIPKLAHSHRKVLWTADHWHLRQYPVLILPGFAQSHSDYCHPPVKEPSLAESVRLAGMRNVEVVPIRRKDWMNLVPAVSWPCFWKSSCTPIDLYRFYIEKVHERVLHLHLRTGKPVVLVGHSAGGWLARALMSDGVWRGGNGNLVTSNLVAGLVTLGTPHYPPARDAVDPTRGALSYVHSKYPGAFLRENGILYLSVAGDAVHGDSFAPRGSFENLASYCYRKVTGTANNGEERGDGVVPVGYAHLEGAEHLTLDDVWHSSFGEAGLWYGSREVTMHWLSKTLDLLSESATAPNR